MKSNDAATRLSSAYEDMESGRYEQARHVFEELANAGEPKANLYLAWMDEQGLGRKADVNAAIARYKVLPD